MRIHSAITDCFLINSFLWHDLLLQDEFTEALVVHQWSWHVDDLSCSSLRSKPRGAPWLRSAGLFGVLNSSATRWRAWGYCREVELWYPGESIHMVGMHHGKPVRRWRCDLYKVQLQQKHYFWQNSVCSKNKFTTKDKIFYTYNIRASVTNCKSGCSPFLTMTFYLHVRVFNLVKHFFLVNMKPKYQKVQMSQGTTAEL